MARHIRDFYMTSARKCKLNNDLSCPDKKKNGRNLQTVCMFSGITSLLIRAHKAIPAPHSPTIVVLRRQMSLFPYAFMH